jgi:hypothetical protein
MVNWLVPHVDLQENGSAVLTIEVGGFTYGNWAEISGYIIQEDIMQGDAIQETGAFVPFSAIQQVPVPDPVNGTSSVTVNVATAGLTPGKDVKVITRVTEVEIWPTVLGAATVKPAVQGAPTVNPAVQGVTGAWQAKEGNPGSDLRAQQWGGQPSAGPTTPAAIVQLSPSDSSISLRDLRPGMQYRITVEAVGP